METESIKKIFFLQDINNYLTGVGVGPQMSNTITFALGIVCLAIIILILDFIGGKVLSNIIHVSAAKSKTKWDDFLVKRKFFSRIFKLFTASITKALIETIFVGFSPMIVTGTKTFISIYITFMVVMTINAFLEVTNDIYKSKPQGGHKSIKGYIQAVQVAIWILGGIIAISILLKQDISTLLTGIAASAAIMTLVFKDTIMGFVASIQISAQDMIRPGDWIEVPAKNANGVVVDMNLTSVKVKNWDKTITSVPIYALVSDAFTNWRSMEEGVGRRIRRHILLDLNSVKVVSAQDKAALENSPFIKDYYQEMMALSELSNTSDFITNCGMYRCYLEAFVKRHPRIEPKELLVVKYSDPNENGITIEIYCFSRDKGMIEYERVIADILENAVIAAPLFGLRFYQRPLDKCTIEIPADEDKLVEAQGDFSRVGSSRDGEDKVNENSAP